MAEDDNPQGPGETEGGTLVPPPEHLDWYLAQVVSVCNRFKLEIGISLTVGGFVVSGTLIDGASYFEEVSKRFATATGNIPQAGKLFSEIADHITTIYGPPQDGDAEEDATGGLRPAGYIHLRNPSFYSSGTSAPISAKGSVWRMRLSAVDGFTFATLSHD
jgi:hypothetical protein